MAKLVFRDLKADEVECRVATCSQKGVSLLLYKDARCDMNILDETVGSFNWQREHLRDNANCVVSIWDEEKGIWVCKEDVGTESNTEAVKGLASDSFKRACFNWGIGRELYTAPFIWIGSADVELKEKNGKWTTYDKFIVKDLQIEDKKIRGVAIYNASKKKMCYVWGKSKYTATSEVPTVDAPDIRTQLRIFIEQNGLDSHIIRDVCGLNHNSTDEDFASALIYAQSLISR